MCCCSSAACCARDGIVGPNVRLQVRCQLARAYKALGKFDVAEEILMNILADDPKFTLAQTMLDSLKKKSVVR